MPIEPASASPSPPVSEGACGACGEPVAADDARCAACGHRPAGVEHAEEVLADPGGTGATVLGAGVTDRGHRRRRNEDAFALERVETEGGAAVVAVVCDGVASVPGGATASRTACDVAVAAGRDALAAGQDLDRAAAAAADAARRAVAALAPGVGAAPACTYVAAVLDTGRAVVTWVGDSRAYWLCPASPEDSAVLTEDDSWAAEMVAAGVVGEEDALSDPRAHVITRWLAADAPDVLPRHGSWALDDSGVLLLCSDGVWNHLPEPAVLAAALGSEVTPADGDAVHAGAKALVDAALAEGGHDNATAVLLAVCM
ncbi:PP2C family protein-serine/threonine phosphatase [Actinomycetospora cinnamomea]|uniref:Serine/threonine protein phosphatase PrpC n=1 Tax=Actinomycetospora cinnamomea TaxID=663609 RepID=A0A2U1E8C7_9PSEU|nr:PP2C family serine/threonine-protein phosphatase [Actinomycetospora cinnamomea]PVY96196.1 serine/threonine protein phosphatase PrpC [Actinomycetospora cinnamomea]